jgi:hypothetical protein
MARRSLNDVFRSERSLRATGKDSATEAYFDTLFDEMEDIAKTREDKLKEQKDAEDFTEDFPVGFRPYNEIWRYEPVTSRYFFGKMFGEKCTPKQQEAVDVICGIDPFDFSNLDWDEAVLMWGKGSGKDSTIAKCFSYQGYKLGCMVNPQAFLGLGKDSPIDFVNVASNANQAKNIFFKYLVAYIKDIKDPDTGLPWFSTKNFYFDVGTRKFKYMDLREKDGDIKKNQIDFQRGISAHSLTSDRFTGEGLTIVLAVMDEVGAMRTERVFGAATGKKDEKLVGQYGSLGSSVRRSSRHGKLMCISYKYGTNCPMSVLVRKSEKKPRIYVRKYSVYEVRTDKTKEQLKEQFRKDYEDDPEKAAMIYECKDPKCETVSLFSNKFVLNNSLDAEHKFTINPVKMGLVTIDDISKGVSEILEPWFRGESEYYYAIHLDLAKGQTWSGGDAVGFVMGHMQEMRVRYDQAWLEFYKKEYDVDLSDYQGQLRAGIVIDLALQVTCKRSVGEVRIADVRKFAIDLQEKRGFGLIKVTADRWGSEETIQEFNRHGIEAEQMSVDRTKAPYYTMKDYMQQGIWKIYPHYIWRREAEEVMDVGNKIEHPDVSIKRFETEGVEHGSKDVLDGCAAVTQTLVKELMENGAVFFG